MTMSLMLVLAGLSGDVSLKDHLPSGVWLLDDGALAQSPPPLPQRSVEDPPVQVRSLSQLKADYAALEDSKPGLAGGIVLLAIGGTIAVNGLFALLFGSLSSTFLIVGLVFAGIGLPLALVGVWLLVTRIAERRAIDAELEGIQRQIDRPEAPGFFRVMTPHSGILLASF